MSKSSKRFNKEFDNINNSLSRRTFMKSAGYLSVAVAGGMVAAGCKSNIESDNHTGIQNTGKNNSHNHNDTLESNPSNIGLMFFSNLDEAKSLAYAAERIFPADENGPGALELGVIYFIDNQCAGGWGNHEREYMSGPFKQGVAEQGYQSAVLRKNLLKIGAQGLLKEADSRYQDYFYNLSPSKQDSILKDMESDKVALESGISSKYFFQILKSITIAGVFSDPIYNGNKNMQGWKMKKYPGAQMMYIDTIMEKEFVEIPPVSLSDMHKID